MNKLIIIFGLPLVVFIAGLSTSIAEDEIKIAAIFAKSGEAAYDNLAFFEGIRFAVDEVNAQGELHKKIKLIEYDNHSTAIQSLLVAKQAVKDGVVAVIGASWSSHSLAIAPYLQKMKVPMISPDSTHPDVTKAGDYIFRACFTDSFQGKALAMFAKDELKADRAVIVRNIVSDYSLNISKVFEQNFTSRGGKVLAVLNYKFLQTDFTNLLKEAKKLDSDLLFIPGHSESGRIVKKAQEIGIKSKILGGDGWPYRKFYANGGRDLKKGYCTTHWNKDLETEKNKDFIARYETVYTLTDFAAIAYDAAMLLFDAIKRAGSIDRPAIRYALAETKDFEGVTGKISFNANGDPIKSVVVMKITDGRPAFFTTITPDSEILEQ